MRLPTPSLAISVTALLVALGGTGYAAATIDGDDVQNNSLTGKDIQQKSLTGKDIADGSVKAKDLKKGTLDQGGRWVLINAAGQIEAQSGGFTVTAAYPTLANTAVAPAPDNSLRANGNVYINAGEDLTDNGLVASISLQNTLDQNGDANMNGRAASSNADGTSGSVEFSGEIGISRCAPTNTAGSVFVTQCAPANTNNVNTFVVSPRLSNGDVTTDTNRKRFYVIINGDSTDVIAAQ